MTRSRFDSAPPQPPPFLDREEEVDLIASHIAALQGDARHFKVLEVLGLGGMGKTRLLEVLWLQALDARREAHLLWVSLEGEGSTNGTGPLVAMRDQLELDCLLFDTALLAYWNAIGQPLQLERSARLANSLAVKALELGGSVAGFILPIGFGLTVFESIARMARKRVKYEPEDFEEIERLHKRPRELLERLPYYLGSDLKRWIDASGEWFLAFYDAYDRQRASTREAGAPWMRQFIATLDQGVHVVSTREPLGWDAREWGDVIAEVSLDALPEPDARDMVRGRLGTLQPDVEDRLIAAARRIPFLLDTVITDYAQLASQAADVDVEALPASPDSAVAQFLEHLPNTQRELAIALASSQVFDEHLFRHTVRALNVQVSFQSFSRFLDWYFVEPLSPTLYKTHDLLTAFVREAPSEEPSRLAALEAATEHLLDRCRREGGPNADTALPILRAVIAGWHSTRAIPTGSIETLIDVAFLLYDAGYWNELASVAAEPFVEQGLDAAVLKEFLLAVTARRIVGVERAVRRFAALMPRAGREGGRAASVELEAAYVRGLAGDYAHARKEFRRLAESTQPFDPSDRTHVRARMYQGGMLLMDGSFRRSSRLLLETYEAVDPEASVDWGELVRYRGHAHRFSFVLDQAEQLYLRALQSATGGRAPALLGRLQTNLAETYCWSQPRRALAAADAAVEIHGALGNRIELAKCDAARGIALAKLGEFERSRGVVARAAMLADEVGYEGGVAFALQAKVIAEWLAGDRDAARVAARELSAVVERIGTYRHLLACPLLLLGEEAGFARLASEMEWLTAHPLDVRIASYLGAA
jgi:tetratricopeptide (TPR) repeat protein